MRPPQRRHLPRSAMYPSTGTLDHNGTGWRQSEQKEAGRTIDISRGRRYATTLTKLPTEAPKKNTITVNSQAPESVMGLL